MSNSLNPIAYFRELDHAQMFKGMVGIDYEVIPDVRLGYAVRRKINFEAQSDADDLFWYGQSKESRRGYP